MSCVTWKQAKLRDKSRGGYLMPLCGFLFAGVVWAVEIVVAALLCLIYIVSSVGLWFCGLWGIYVWGHFEMHNRRPGKRPFNRDRKTAWDIVEKLNGTPDGRTFRVDQLLMTTTGYDMEDLAIHIRRREEAALSRANGIDDRPSCDVSITQRASIER